MNQMLQQGMLARMVGGMTGGAATDQLSGGVMARGAAIGRPLLSAAQGMLGLDPLSLGMRAGQMAWGGGAGVLGAGLAGAGAMAGVGMLGAGVNFAGQQMMTGVQQQLGLNTSLRNNFNFMNNQGGMGFTSAQGFQIGDQLRGMTGIQGPGGEVASFGELSRLASNMGRMGMAQNVRTVKEFKDNFKQMVDTLKVMAHDLGTSMEEAQKMMASMKNSGVFSRAGQAAMTGQMRLGALAGGLALSEMSGAANIGSQISRSVGGLGRQGAFAGMKTMEQIGVAQRTGAISEEDIYNATGLTGAEGRQALAATQMQQSASFLSGGRGRRFLASIAGRNGQLNESAVSEWLSGGMSTGRTMELAGENLSGVGRANFIRNEGRLRGAALEKFGGLAQSMVYSQWLQSRGHDPNNMDDRSMLAFQRFSGMGRDEADLAIKQIQGMPEMLREMNETKRGVGYSDMLAQKRNTQGVEGMRRKFDAAREEIQGKLQGVGANILRSGTEQLESWFNGVMGIYVSTATEGIDKIAKNMELGGAGAKRDYARYFGGGGGAGGAFNGKAAAAAAQNQKYQFAAMGGSTNQSLVSFAQKNTDFMKVFSLGAQDLSPEAMVQRFGEELANKAGSDPAAKEALAAFRKAGMSERIAMLQTGQAIAGAKSTVLDALKGQDFDLTGKGKYNSQADFERTVGGQLSGRTQRQHEIMAKVFGEGGASKIEGWDKAYRESGIGRLLDAPGQLLRDAFGMQDEERAMARVYQDPTRMGLLSDAFSGDKERAGAARSGLLDEVDKIRKGKKELDATDRGTVNMLAAGALASKHGGAIAAFSKEGMKGKGVADYIKEHREVTGDYKTSDEEIMRVAVSATATGAKAAGDHDSVNRAEDMRRITKGIEADRDSAISSGYMTLDKKGELVLSKRSQEARKGLSADARRAMDLADSVMNLDMTKEGSHKAYYDLMGMSNQQFAALDEKELQKITRAGGGRGDQAGYMLQLQKRFKSMSKGEAGEAGAVAQMLGIDVSGTSFKGMSAQQQVAEILRKGGVQDEGLQKDLTAALGKKTVGEKALGVQDVLQNMSKETKEKLQDSKKQQEDPNYRIMQQLREEAGKTNALLKIIATQKPATAEEIAAATGGGTEKKKPAGT